MIKQYENYEVWFVTGAQLLYGGDAVVQVDGHSNEMVAGMNARYWGVTWDGDYHVTWPDFAGEKFNGLHYHRDVRQALLTAPSFRNHSWSPDL